MRWPIRNQILLPLIFVQLLVVICVAGLGAWTALRRVERDVQNRFAELAGIIQQSTFPFTSAVLEQMRGLSGAQFILFDERGSVLATTLNAHVVAESARELSTIALADTGISNEVPLSSGPARRSLPVSLQVGGVQYLAVRVHAVQQQGQQNVMALYPDALVQSARQNAIVFPILLGLLTLVLSTIAVMFVAQHIGNRIQAIERQVAHIAQGNFQQIPLDSRHDELRDLSASVNQMSQQLDQFTARIRTTERALLLKQLAGGIAHQLRNSLTGARLALQLHRRRCGHSEEESLHVALRQLALTEEQIRGLVALIRDEHRPRVPGRYSSLLQEVAALVLPMCEHRQIRLQIQGDAGEIWLADSDQIRAALLNLCINAIEATTAGGRVVIDSAVHGQEIAVDVSDDGPGVQHDRIDSIFDPFQTSKPDGMGLGLALVKQTAEDHFGSVQYLREHDRTIFRLICRGQFDEVPAVGGEQTDPSTTSQQ